MNHFFKLLSSFNMQINIAFAYGTENEVARKFKTNNVGTLQVGEAKTRGLH